MVGWRRPEIIAKVLLFQVFLLPVAMIANGIWSCTIWGRFY
jgi:hypothetical protein